MLVFQTCYVDHSYYSQTLKPEKSRSMADELNDVSCAAGLF